MNLIRTNGLAAIGHVSLFVAIGALLAYVQMLLETTLADEALQYLPDVIVVLFALVLVQCLITIAALASWKFAVGDTYWKAPVLCFLVFLSALLMVVFLLHFIPDEIVSDLPLGGAQLRAFVETRPARGALLVGVMTVGEAVGVFATFAFVIRAMIVRSGKWAGLVFLLIGTVTGSCLTLSVDSTATSLLQPPFLLGLSALAFRVLPTKSSAPTIQTHLVEAR
jgi:hypothetical protein